MSEGGVVVAWLWRGCGVVLAWLWRDGGAMVELVVVAWLRWHARYPGGRGGGRGGGWHSVEGDAATRRGDHALPEGAEEME